MPKHLLEDMKVPKHQGKEIRKEFIKEPKKELKESERKEISKSNKIKQSLNKKRPRYMLWFVAFICVVSCFLAISFLFSKAEIKVNPKVLNKVLKENLSGSKDSSADSLSFSLVVIKGQETKTLEATETQNVALKATGRAVIFNAFSSTPQKLNIDTRLEGSNGKIYKTQTKITIPGMSKDGIPGSVDVGIYASLAGPAYNSAPLDFKIFGFKGTSKYEKIYGRSKGEISGGFIGKAPVIADADKILALADLKATLQTKLSQKATDQIPSGFVLFKDAVFLNTDDINNGSNISSVYNGDNSLTLTMSGTLYGIVFNEQKLTQKIATDNIDQYDGSAIYIPDIRDLSFTLSNKDNISFDNVKNIDFNLAGPAKIVWKVDTNKLTGDLLGKSKGDFNQILAQYPNINSATLTLTPIWSMSIPDKSKNVKIIVNYPQ